jgi:hypothetical protein
MARGFGPRRSIPPAGALSVATAPMRIGTRAKSDATMSRWLILYADTRCSHSRTDAGVPNASRQALSQRKTTRRRLRASPRFLPLPRDSEREVPDRRMGWQRPRMTGVDARLVGPRPGSNRDATTAAGCAVAEPETGGAGGTSLGLHAAPLRRHASGALTRAGRARRPGAISRDCKNGLDRGHRDFGGRSPRSRGGLGLRLGLRAASWRVAAQLGAAHAWSEVTVLQALPRMARPGLEPGTPRFSGSRGRAVHAPECLQIRDFKMRHRGAVPLVSAGFPRVWDSMDGLKSQMLAGDLLGAIHQLCLPALPDQSAICRVFERPLGWFIRPGSPTIVADSRRVRHSWR